MGPQLRVVDERLHAAGAQGEVARRYGYGIEDCAMSDVLGKAFYEKP